MSWFKDVCKCFFFATVGILNTFLILGFVWFAYCEYYDIVDYDITNIENSISYYNGNLLGVEGSNISFKIDRDYERSVYNCVNFSQDLQKRLNEKNISSVKIRYFEGGNFSHQVIGVLVEPQTGEVIPIKKFKWIKLIED